MNPALRRFAVLTGLLLLLAGCELLEPGEPVVRALTIDRSSLPSHRHGDTIERVERRFLARQNPGDRLIIAGLLATTDPSQSNSLLIQLADRPLLATRSLRQLNRRMTEGRDGSEHNALSQLVTITETLSDTEGAACLYLAFDPDRVAPPPSDSTFSRRTGPAGNGWKTFILIPEAADMNHERIGEWIHHIHHLGSSRTRVSRLNEGLPEC